MSFLCVLSLCPFFMSSSFTSVSFLKAEGWHRSLSTTRHTHDVPKMAELEQFELPIYIPSVKRTRLRNIY